MARGERPLANNPFMQTTFHLRAAAFVAVALAFSCAGCATSYEVKVNSLRRPDFTQQEITSYTIRTRTQVGAEDRLRFQEAAQHIRTALSAKGLFEAPNADSADMVVELDYGLAPARKKREAYQELVLTESQAPPLRQGELAPIADRPMLEFEDAERPVIVHEKQLSICGRQNRPPADGRPPQELFHVYVSIEDESRDIRGYLPVLASVAMDQIGRESGGETTTWLSANDEAIRFIKKGL
jgi:hypothetical protein